MRELPNVIRLHPLARSRPYILDLFALDALVITALKAFLGHRPLDHGDSIKPSLVTNVELVARVDGFIQQATSGKFLEILELNVRPRSNLKDMQCEFSQLSGLAIRAESAAFITFVETASDWIKAYHGTDYHKWPPIANFCRVIRNAIVHGGRINIQSPTAPKVEWRGLTLNN